MYRPYHLHSRPYVHGARIMLPWHQPPPPFVCTCANLDNRCKSAIARNVMFYPSGYEDVDGNHHLNSGYPNMGVRAQKTKSGLDNDSLMYYSLIETPKYEEYLEMDEFENLCISEPSSPTRCDLFNVVQLSHVCYLYSLTHFY